MKESKKLVIENEPIEEGDCVLGMESVKRLPNDEFRTNIGLVRV